MENTVTPMVDVLSELTTKRVVMSEEGYVYLDTLEIVAADTLQAGILKQKAIEDDKVVAEQIKEAKDYLDSTDFKMTIDYYATLTLEQQAELTTKRADARAFLKGQGL